VQDSTLKKSPLAPLFQRGESLPQSIRQQFSGDAAD